MNASMHSFDHLPNAPGVGFKPQHFVDIVERPGAVEWLEVHAENYMGHGGRPIAQLKHLAEKIAISVHGVGLSIGGEGPLDTDHLARLKYLLNWLKPARFSEHLAWSTHDGAFLNDLLPLPYTDTVLTRVADHIDEVQTTLGRQILLENPSSYLAFDASTLSEVEFLTVLVKRTGCGLLLDVNNVFVSATNLGFDPTEYIDALPLQTVEEIHLAGHDKDQDENGKPVLIDSHGCQASEPVWALFEHVIDKCGPKPSLIEWDTEIPDWPILEAEAARIASILKASVA